MKRISEKALKSAVLQARRDRFQRSPGPGRGRIGHNRPPKGEEIEDDSPKAVFLSESELAEYLALRDEWAKDCVLYARVRLGMNPSWQQAEIMRAATEPGSKVTVRSGHGIGKSAALAAIIWWMLETQPSPKIVATAPTAAQLYQILWSEITKWSRKSDEWSRRIGLNPTLWLSALFSVNSEAVRDRGAPREVFCVARTANKPDALQGFHASNLEISEDGKSVVSSDESSSLLFVLEEASGIDDLIFEVAEGALSSKGSRLLMAGNPTRNTGYFARSHKQDRGSFTAPLHFRSGDSPLTDPDYRAKLVKKFGEGSNVVRVRADGEFPKQDDDALIPFEAVEAAIDRVIEPPEPEPGVRPEPRRPPRRRLGVDVARYGNDRSTFLVREGREVVDIEVSAKEDTMQTTGRVVAMARKWKPQDIFVDVIGVGAGVVDRLSELVEGGELVFKDVIDGQAYEWRPRIHAVNVSESAPERTGEDADEIGYRLRDHLWLVAKRWFINDEPSFAKVPTREHAQDLAGELSIIRYAVHSNGTLVIESKDDMKKRNEGRSPDIAESLIVTFHEPPLPSKVVAHKLRGLV